MYNSIGQIAVNVSFIPLRKLELSLMSLVSGLSKSSQPCPVTEMNDYAADWPALHNCAREVLMKCNSMSKYYN